MTDFYFQLRYSNILLIFELSNERSKRYSFPIKRYYTFLYLKRYMRLWKIFIKFLERSIYECHCSTNIHRLSRFPFLKSIIPREK